MKISKWGNSLAVRLPREVVKQLGLKLGDEVEVRAAEEKVLTVSTAEAGRRAALERLRKFRGLLPADYQFDREEAHER